MNLPVVQHIKRTTKINVKDKRINNKVKKLNLLNFFLLPNNNISSILHGKKNKIETDFRKTTQSTNNINNINQKIIITTKTKRLFFHNSNSNYFNSFKIRKNAINNTNHKIEEDEKENYNKYIKYIKNTLNSLKIKKEISSYLYSSPEKQIRIINFLSLNLNKLTPQKIINNNQEKSDSKKLRTIKIMRKFIKSEYNLENDYEKDKDEDKTNLKEYTFFPLFTKDKNLPSKKIKYMRNKDKNYLESWDNNLLKNILPQNIKCHYEIESNEDNTLKRGITSLNINTMNDKDNTIKYNSEKKIHNYINKIGIKSYKRK